MKWLFDSLYDESYPIPRSNQTFRPVPFGDSHRRCHRVAAVAVDAVVLCHNQNFQHCSHRIPSSSCYCLIVSYDMGSDVRHCSTLKSTEHINWEINKFHSIKRHFGGFGGENKPKKATESKIIATFTFIFTQSLVDRQYYKNKVKKEIYQEVNWSEKPGAVFEYFLRFFFRSPSENINNRGSI